MTTLSLSASRRLSLIVCLLVLFCALKQWQPAMGQRENDDDFDDSGFDDSGYNSPGSHEAEGSNQNPSNYSPSSEEDLDEDDDTDETRPMSARSVAPQAAAATRRGLPEAASGGGIGGMGAPISAAELQQLRAHQQRLRGEQQQFQQQQQAYYANQALAGPQRFYDSANSVMLANVAPLPFSGQPAHRYRRSTGDSERDIELDAASELELGRPPAVLVRRRRHSKYIGPVYTYVKTDKHARVKWGVKHKVGKHYG